MVAAQPLHQPEMDRLAEAMAAAPDLTSLSLRIEARGLANQREMLMLGIDFEGSPGVADVILERCTDTSAVFLIHGTDISALLADGESLEGFAVELAPTNDASDVLSLVATRREAQSARRMLRAVTSDTAVAAPVPLAWPSVEQRLEANVALAEVDTVVAPDARPGGRPPTHEDIVLTAGQFHSFDRVNAFQDGVTALDGVHRVEVGRFYRGTLRLKIQYEGMIPLAQRLRQLEGFGAIAISEQGEDTIDVSLPE